MLNQGIILCLSFTMIVGVTLFLFVNQKIKKLDKSVDTMIELIYGYSKELNTYKENITELVEKNQTSGVTGSSSGETTLQEDQLSQVHEVYGNNPSKKIYINGNGITSVINEPNFRMAQQIDSDLSPEKDERVVVSDDEESNSETYSETIAKSSLYDDVLDKITKDTEELVDTKPKIVKLDFDDKVKSLFRENDVKVNSESDNDDNLEVETETEVDVDYSKFSVNKLKSLLKEKNYDGRSVNKMKKQELVYALENINKVDGNDNEDYDTVIESSKSDNESMKNTISTIFKTNNENLMSDHDNKDDEDKDEEEKQEQQHDEEQEQV